MTGPMTIAEQRQIERDHTDTLTAMLAYARARVMWNAQAGHVFASRRYRRLADALEAAVIEMRDAEQ